MYLPKSLCSRKTPCFHPAAELAEVEKCRPSVDPHPKKIWLGKSQVKEEENGGQGNVCKGPGQ
jgi:hypothetical protein